MICVTTHCCFPRLPPRIPHRESFIADYFVSFISAIHDTCSLHTGSLLYLPGDIPDVVIIPARTTIDRSVVTPAAWPVRVLIGCASARPAGR